MDNETREKKEAFGIIWIINEDVSNVIYDYWLEDNFFKYPEKPETDVVDLVVRSL